MLPTGTPAVMNESHKTLPTGTITFLFTDVVGNVPIWERDPTAMKAALGRHHDILYAAAQHHHGLVFKILGDEFQIAFELPENALEAALEAQHGLRAEPWGATGPLTVRMGLHTGPAEVIEGALDTPDYAVSHTINRVARIRSSAHGGQILLSSATSELLHGYRPEAIHLRDLGECYLKGMSIPEHVFQVVVPDLPDAFPPLLSLSHPNHNLPTQLTSFIGREKEIAAAQQLLQTARLVTLTGPGGTGKTRLAMQVAAGLLEQFEDGVWLVELAPLSDPTLVPAIAARALGLREQSGPQMIGMLQDYLEHKQLLLILDNCEHVIDACVRLANALLRSCPKLSILTSSREALGIPGEVPFRVPPLSLPETQQIPSFKELAPYEAIRLFIERAVTVSPSFAITPANTPAVIQVCQRLDGIPLAIELAAARVKLLQVNEIAQRLDDRFRLLTGGSRAALPRYQTLRASIDWSYELLSPAERSLLQRLSVFAGSWVVEAAEAVGCGEGLQACDVLELLGQLVDKSLIQTVSEADDLTRFRMLETIRQYAHEKLVEAGQAEAARQRHLQYYLDLAEKTDKVIRGPDIARLLDGLEAELDNLRLALAWSLERKGQPGWNPEPGLRLAAALLWFWHCRGRQEEGIQWLELLLAGEAEERGDRPLTPERTRCRARALYVAAYSANLVGEPTKSARLGAESIELYRSLGADGRLGYAYALITSNNHLERDLKEDRRLAEERLAIFRAEGDRFGMAESFQALGYNARVCKEYDRARGYFEEGLALKRESGDLDGIAGCYWLLGVVAFSQGKVEKAQAFVEASYAKFCEVHNKRYQGVTQLQLGEFDMLEGNYMQAAGHNREALSIGRRQGDVVLICEGLTRLGYLALVQEQHQEAAELFEESLAYTRRKDHKNFIAYSLWLLGLLAWSTGELEQASRLYAEALNNCRAGGNLYLEQNILCELGKVALARGEINQARAQFEQAIQVTIPYIYTNYDAHHPTLKTLEAMAAFTAAQGQTECNARSLSVAARLLGATEAWHTRAHHARIHRMLREREACIATLRTAMSEQAFAAAWAEGEAMTEDQAVEVALAFCRQDAAEYSTGS
jgi:predicted ATPase/class 3 adenylate cyclase